MKCKLSTLCGLFIGAIMLSVTGCSDEFLDVKPKEAQSVDDFFTTQSDAISAVNAAYASLQYSDLYSWDFGHTLTAASDNAIAYQTNDMEINNLNITPSYPLLETNWSSLYEGAFRSNLVLQNVPDMDIDEDFKNRLLGEARFLRALYYWHLLFLFGEVPLVTQASPNNTLNAHIPKSTIPEIIDQIESDAKEAINLLPRRESYSDSNIGRATEGAAKSLLGIIYLYSASPIYEGNNEGYALAAAQFKDVIENYSYQLVDYQKLWVEDNNAEQIFEIQYMDVGGGIWQSSDGAGVNENNLRAVLRYPVGRGGESTYLPTQELANEFENYSGPDPQNNYRGRDPRMFYSLWRQGDYFDEIDPVYQSSWTPTNYSFKKGMAFPFTGRTQDGTFRNIPIIRLGDVYLMYAEAVNAKSNREPQEAIDAINAVRQRVNMPTYPNPNSPYSVNANSSEQEIFESIVHERRVELADEYKRFIDLRRWQLAEQEREHFQAPKFNFYPLPRQEVQINENLEQNPEW